MKILREHFEAMISQVKDNRFLNLKTALLAKPSPKPALEFIENDYKIKYPKEFRDFMLEISVGVKIKWEVSEAAITDLKLEGEERFMNGQVSICGAREMVFGVGRSYWKDIFWFDQVNSELNDQLKRFAPFDLADGFRCVTGFLKEGDDETGYVISDQLYLNRENKELIPHPFTFEEYLEFLLKAKGYSGLLACYNDPFDEEHKRFMKVMPLLFDDFDKDYFLKLSERK